MNLLPLSDRLKRSLVIYQLKQETSFRILVCLHRAAQKNGRAIGYMPGRLEGIEGLDWTSLIDSDHVVHVINDAQATIG